MRLAEIKFQLIFVGWLAVWSDFVPDLGVDLLRELSADVNHDFVPALLVAFGSNPTLEYACILVSP